MLAIWARDLVCIGTGQGRVKGTFTFSCSGDFRLKHLQKNLKIQGYTPTVYRTLQLYFHRPYLPSLHLLPCPPSFLFFRFPGYDLGALPEVWFGVWGSGRPLGLSLSYVASSRPCFGGCVPSRSHCLSWCPLLPVVTVFYSSSLPRSSVSWTACAILSLAASSASSSLGLSPPLSLM